MSNKNGPFLDFWFGPFLKVVRWPQFCFLVATSCNLGQLLATFAYSGGKWWQFVVTFDYLWQLWVTCYNSCNFGNFLWQILKLGPFLATFCNFLVTCGNHWQLFVNWVKVSKSKSVWIRKKSERKIDFCTERADLHTERAKVGVYMNRIRPTILPLVNIYIFLCPFKSFLVIQSNLNKWCSATLPSGMVLYF